MDSRLLCLKDSYLPMATLFLMRLHEHSVELMITALLKLALLLCHMEPVWFHFFIPPYMDADALS